jgi:thioesterase domain-containing protein
MVSDADMLEVQDAGLARLAELQLALAEKLYRLADATEDASEAADLATALERTSRSVRLTYALRAKLRRDARRAEREDADAQNRRDREQVRFRKHRLKTGVEALVWRETDCMDQEAEADFGDLLDALVDDEAASEAFLTEPLADQVARVIAGLGYEITGDGTVRPLAAHPRECGDPGFRSSA